MKALYLQTDSYPKTRVIEFKSPQQYNMVVDTLCGSLFKEDPDFIIDFSSDRYTSLVKLGSIRSLIYPARELNDPEFKEISNVHLVFADQSDLLISINGGKRGMNAVMSLKVLLNKSPSNLFFRVIQDDNKFALIRHYAILQEIHVVFNDSQRAETAVCCGNDNKGT